MQNHFNIENIRIKSEKILADHGLTLEDAKIVVDSMLMSDMYGVSTHGIRMLPSYVQKMDKGEFAYISPKILKQFTAFTIVDAQNTIGAVSATYAARIAVRQAQKSGIHTVFSRNANTFGAGFYYADQIANAGMIGFVCCNSPAAMPAYNGLEAMLGTNPLAFAAPTQSYGNIVMDMATSIVSKSKFGVAKAKGERLAEGWALDKYGNPTTDPDEGIQGLVLPMAGFKGYEIAMIIDIMSGFLSGASFLNDVGKFYSIDGSCMNVGHMIVAINPEVIYDGNYMQAADHYVEKLKGSKVISSKNIIIPGDRGKLRKKEAVKNGICLTYDTVKNLESLFGCKLF